jgi:hypothetical protein
LCKNLKAESSEYEDGVRINRPQCLAAATTATVLLLIIIIIIIDYSYFFVYMLTQQPSGQLRTKQDHETKDKAKQIMSCK